LRLIDTQTGRFAIFKDPSKADYIALSHVTAKPSNNEHMEREVLRERTYQDLIALQASLHDGDSLLESLPHTDKLRNACRVSLQMGYKYIWIDTCCVDQSDAAAFAAANSATYSWYRQSSACLVFLHDVDPRGPSDTDAYSLIPRLLQSEWFRRGWTLQELLAPNHVLFIAHDWSLLGTKATLAHTMHAATGIDPAVLTRTRALADVSVAERLSWAAARRTLIAEDEAYCLAGIFDVRVEPAYGEGGARAFSRVQRAIYERTQDQSIFAWGARVQDGVSLGGGSGLRWGGAGMGGVPALLPAPSPRLFASCADIKALSADALARKLGGRSALPDFEVTPYGLRARLPLVEGSDDSGVSYHLTFLACEDREGRYIALLL
ncbi:uncharacterized protein BXZ73DRAFT_14932, partial [Epithele typhae]|uniref:uncharacterized protein n=1 Tax=Epithele typhae TaxID=378194 RepID=UPI0020080913